MKTPDIFIFLGPPGSGKGTLSRTCINEFGWTQLSTGNLCREHIANQTEIGKEIDFAIKSGKLISDKLVLEMVSSWLQTEAIAYKGIILDGFPRTVEQATQFDSMIRNRNQDARFEVIQLNVADDEIIERVSSRIVCENKKCQAVFSIRKSVLKPMSDNTCDVCSSKLIQRSDDTQEAIIDRLKTYRLHEGALIDFYKGRGKKIHALDAQLKPHVIFDNLKDMLNLQKI